MSIKKLLNVHENLSNKTKSGITRLYLECLSKYAIIISKPRHNVIRLSQTKDHRDNKQRHTYRKLIALTTSMNTKV